MEKAQADWFVEQIRHSLAEQDIVTIQYKLDIKDIQGIDHLNGPQGEVYYEAKVCPLEVEYQAVVPFLFRAEMSLIATKEKRYFDIKAK